jgi:hypothetical protein
MKPNESQVMTKSERIFIGVWAVAVLMLLPLWGPDAMLLGAGVALASYAYLFKEHIRKRGWLMAVIPLSVAAVVGAAIAFALGRGH